MTQTSCDASTFTVGTDESHESNGLGSFRAGNREVQQRRASRKRSLPDDAVADSPRKAQKRANTTDSQSTLPFAPPPLSPPATQTTLTTSAPCPVDEDDDEEERLVEKTIRADERIEFQPDWSIVVGSGSRSHRVRTRTKRSTGSSRISFIYKHGLQLERKAPNGQYKGKYWLCKHCYDRKKTKAPLAATATSQPTVHLQKWHNIGSSGVLDEPPQLITPHLTPTPHFDRHKPTAEAFIDNFIHWVGEEDITFLQASSDRLRQLIAAGGPEMATWIPSANTRLRGLGHVINLVVQSLLYGENLSTFKKELDGASDFSQFKLWRRKGAIGKVHNRVVYICRSEQRIGVFSEIQRELADELKTSALRLKKDTGAAVEAYCHQWQRPKGKDANDLSADFLDEQDWEEVRHFRELLRPFNTMSVLAQGKADSGQGGVLWEVLPVFDNLFNHLKARQDEVIEKPHVLKDHYQHAVNAAFVKMKHYYELTDDARLYRMAIALHPLCRSTWFTNNWSNIPDGASEIANAHKAVVECWDEYFTLRDAAQATTNSYNLTSTSLTPTTSSIDFSSTATPPLHRGRSVQHDFKSLLLMKSWLIGGLVDREKAWRVLNEIEQQALLTQNQQPTGLEPPAASSDTDDDEVI
ncbi:hypothetical protein KC318_g700 [Hortaea werneckii]|nr:hypothetical protein KC334_g855 [Hortaea werneckii]KAI7675814.1 hypothetical protein KC318_g700 [Hortaea werneckii]